MDTDSYYEVPTELRAPCNVDDLDAWMQGELAGVRQVPYRTVIRAILENSNLFIEWPKRAELFWPGCTRKREIDPVTKKRQYHKYPELLQSALREDSLKVDARANGPAILAFRLAGGIRPIRKGSTTAWNVHHIYDGRFPYLRRSKTLRAVEAGLHFTQTAGLVAVHPVVHALCEEYSCFAWFLRAKSYQLFGYDPDGVFSAKPLDKYGFAPGRSCFHYLEDGE